MDWEIVLFQWNHCKIPSHPPAQTQPRAHLRRESISKTSLSEALARHFCVQQHTGVRPLSLFQLCNQPAAWPWLSPSASGSASHLPRAYTSCFGPVPPLRGLIPRQEQQCLLYMQGKKKALPVGYRMVRGGRDPKDHLYRMLFISFWLQMSPRIPQVEAHVPVKAEVPSFHMNLGQFQPMSPAQQHSCQGQSYMYKQKAVSWWQWLPFSCTVLGQTWLQKQTASSAGRKPLCAMASTYPHNPPTLKRCPAITDSEDWTLLQRRAASSCAFTPHQTHKNDCSRSCWVHHTVSSLSFNSLNTHPPNPRSWVHFQADFPSQ